MQRIIRFLNQNSKIKELVLYIFFGGCTTLTNWLVYFPLTNTFAIHYQIANVVAWICAVLFAYITNKRFVFKSQTNTAQETMKELSAFLGARILSLLLEMLIMQIFVDWLYFNSNIMKIATAVLTVIFNYIASKLVIFKNQNQEGVKNADAN